MKKLLILLISVCFSFLFLISANAANETKEITVSDSSGKVVASFGIETENSSQNARTNIQNALNYCRDNATSQNIHTVSLPTGKYYISSTLNLFSNTVLDLSSSVLYREKNCGSMVRFGKGTDVSYGYEGYSNITVKNGTFDGNETGTSSLFHFAHASDVTLEALSFRNTKNVRHLLTFAASKNVNILNCSFSDMKISDSLSSSNCEAIQIDILKEKYFVYPAYDGTITKNVTISGCNFENVHRGIGTHSGIAGYYFKNISIKNNTFSNIENYAIRAVNYLNSEISGNTLSSCGSGISCSTVTNEALSNYYAPIETSEKLTGKLNVKISDNKISVCDTDNDSTAYAIRVFGKNVSSFKDKDGKTFSADLRISDVSIENNTISSSVSKKHFYAIHIYGAKGSEYSEKSDLCVKGNKITLSCSSKHKATIYAIRIEDSENVFIKSNKIYDSKKHLHTAVSAEHSKTVMLYSNTITSSGGFGIKLTDVSRAKISKNTVLKTKSNGIYVTAKSKSVCISSNKVSAVSGYGIAVTDSAAGNIKSNRVYNCSKAGIYITKNASAETISSNYVCNSKGNGIYLNSNGSATTVSKNRIDLTSDSIDAISVNDKAKVTNITNNKINCKEDKSSKDLKVKSRYGIRINSSSCKIKKISGNTVKSCKNSAIYISKLHSKAKVTIEKNKIYSCKYGVCYLKGKASVKNNTFKKCSSAKTKIIK